MDNKKIYSIIIVLSMLIVAGIIWMATYSFKADKWMGKKSSEESATVSEAQESDKIIVGFSQVGSESVWRTVNTDSVVKALSAENGYYLISENGRQRQENQLKSIRNFISQKVDYIVFSPIVQDGWTGVLKEANEAGIPVIIMDRMVSRDERKYATAWIGSDSEEEGRKAGEWLENYMTSKGRKNRSINIVVLKGTIGSSAQLGRSMGFDKVAGQHENWHILAQEEGDFTTALGKEKMQKVIDAYPEATIDVVVCQNDDMAFGAVEVLHERGFTTGKDGGVCVISFDATRAGLEMVSEGIINVDIECNPLQGEYVRNIIERLERGESVEPMNYVDESVFTNENVDKYLKDRKY